MEDKELLLKLGSKIRYERMKHKLSQEELAEKANMNMRSISTIECGLTDIRFTTLHKIANALNVDVPTITDFKL